MRYGSLVGALLLATGRGRGIARFGDSRQAFLASLAPLLAFPLVGALFLLLSGHGLLALKLGLVTLVAQLAPAISSHALALRLGREEDWLRYATAFNWCQLVIPVAAVLLFIVVAQLGGGGRLNEEQAAELLVIILGLYGLWLHWVVARHGLVLSRLRAAGLVAAVNVVTVMLLIGPGLVAGVLN